MKRSHVVRPLLLAATVALVFWFAHNTHWEDVEEHTPLKTELFQNNFYAVQHLAESLGAHTQVRHDVLSLPPSQAAIFVHFWSWSLLSERRQRLEQWVNDGGRLIVTGDTLSDAGLREWTGVSQVQVETNTSTAPIRRPETMPLTPPDEGTPDSDATSSVKPRKSFGVCNTPFWNRLSTTRKVTWRLEDKLKQTQALRVPIGRGSVTIVNGQPFENWQLLCGDGGRLFVAAVQLHSDDDIEFLTETRSSSLLQLLWNYGSPVIVLAATLIGLWLWRSGIRFGPLAAAPDPARRSLAEQIRGTGRFTLRFGGGRALYNATLRALNEAAAGQVPRYERLSGEERVATLAALTGLGSNELASALDYGGTRDPHELHRAIAILESARRLIEPSGRVGSCRLK
jgi:hypothetical protein